MFYVRLREYQENTTRRTPNKPPCLLALQHEHNTRLREHVGGEREPTKKQKLIVDLTGDLTGPSQFLVCGPVCFWVPP
jgi:hypothetical protein